MRKRIDSRSPGRTPTPWRALAVAAAEPSRSGDWLGPVDRRRQPAAAPRLRASVAPGAAGTRGWLAAPVLGYTGKRRHGGIFRVLGAVGQIVAPVTPCGPFGVGRDSRAPGVAPPPEPTPGADTGTATGAARHRRRAHHHGCRHHAPAAGLRRPLRTPDPALEPQDEAPYLHRAQWHLHHRFAAEPDLHRFLLRVREEHRGQGRNDPVHRHEEAGSGGHRAAGRARRHAVRQPALARRHAHQLQHGPQAAAATQGAAGDQLRRRRRFRHDEEGAVGPASREGQARAHPRRYPRYAAPAERDLGRGHQQGAHRRRRGAQAGHPGRGHPRHQLRSAGGRLPDPRQRRCHSRSRAADAGDRRRRRRGTRCPSRGIGGRGHRRRADAGVGAGTARGGGGHGCAGPGRGC